MRPSASTLLAAVGLVTLVHAACGDALGKCDPALAEELVYGRAGLSATKGQALLHDACGNAAFCHSSAAKGKARHGAPAGMNFDMLPAPTGWPTVADNREEIWTLVESGEMPPRGVGVRVQGDGDFHFTLAGGGAGAKLPALETHSGKAALRNWLACGAPVVSATRIPDWARPPRDDAGTEVTDFATLYADVLAPSCAISGCHDKSAAGGLRMTDACGAYASLLDAGSCGRPRLVPGDAESVLVDKLASNEPACGSLPMPPPPYQRLPDALLASIRAWIEAGAPAEACP